MLKYFHLQVNKVYFTKKSGSGGTYMSFTAGSAFIINSGASVVKIWLKAATAIKIATMLRDSFFMIDKILLCMLAEKNQQYKYFFKQGYIFIQ